ncbi:SusC/RagA family TonB-linked outer membrane protein [Flexithrix dorotheae]|uniref:SusC/RagA family TonB-linked outer membrane protein n=1 Tax=Flexithrix dorotheae TaxID=70993 RepID=UPI0012FCB4D0|nr:TonB-dependent receptor [Flexithrix dorotheae]
MSKITMFGFLIQSFCFGFLIAKDVNAQKKSLEEVYVNLKRSHVDLKTIFYEISAQTKFEFSYDHAVVNDRQKVKVITRKETLGNILRSLSKDNQLAFKRINGNIFVSRNLKDNPAIIDYNLQQNKVSGKITSSEDGEVLPGVSILILGTTTGTTSDAQGEYSLNVPEGATLKFSYIGYETQDIEVGNQSVLNVTLSPDLEQLEEVVVIGYGTQEKKDLTGAISSVSSEEITQLPTVNVSSALQGRAAGVTVTENSGRPGAGSTVVIRGTGTVGNSNPLYVVDGQILNDGVGLGSINPNDIQSIEVLKDASASAIYGARAANGVVLVTTKRGVDGKTRLSYNGYFGVQQDNDRQVFMSASEYVQNAIDVARAGDTVSPWEDAGDPSQFGEGVNYWDKLWRSGMITDHNFNFSGGNANSQFLVAFGYLKNEGVMIGQDFERYTVRINSDHKIGKRLKVGESLQISRGNEMAIGGTGSFNTVFQGGWRMVPTINPERFPDGSWNGPTRPGEPFDFSTFSPNQYIEEWDDQRKSWQALGNIYAELEIIDGLKFRSTYSGLFNYNDNTSWSPLLENAGGLGRATSLSRNTNTVTNWQWDNILTYEKSFGSHKIAVLGGITAQEDKYEFLNSSGMNFLDENVRVINGSDNGSRQTSGGINEWSLNSYIGRLTYSFKDKYLLQANVRRDGSSRFGESNRWGVFPSFSAGWRLSEEAFMDGLAGISNLKLRGSWGKLGNDQIGLYAFAATVNLNQRYTFGDSQTPQGGAAPLSLANQDIKWEETTQTNFGLDLGVMDNKLLFTLDYFVKNTDDMLLQVPIPSSSGFSSSPFVNAGSVENKGWEFSSIYRKSNGEFQYNITLNLSGIKNEVTSLGNGKRIISGANTGDIIADKGTEVFAFFGYVADGIYQNQAEIDEVNALNSERDYDPGVEPGAVRFKDIDGDGLITDADREVIGSPYPDLMYGLNFNASYKGFDFTLFFQGQQGNDILLANNDNYMIQPGGRLRYNLDRWFKEGDTNDPMLWGVKGFNNASGGRDGRTGSYQVFDGSYFRSKNIQIGYTLPETITDKLGISRFRVYVSSKNLFTIWNNDDYNLINDPELGREGAGFGKYNMTTTPQPKTYLLGLNIDF